MFKSRCLQTDRHTQKKKLNYGRNRTPTN